jgi:large subunit ribosomal protein L25
MAKFELTAEPRDAKGTSASRRLRNSGRIPAIMYGAGKDPVALSLDHNAIFRQLKNESFYTSILTINLGGQKEQAVLRDMHMHPVKARIDHIDLQRISATEKLHMRVPLHFVGQDVAPGVKLQGGLVSHLMNEVDVTCLPHQLPEFLPVDLSNCSLGDSIHLTDIPLPEGVTISSLAHGGDDLAVATITLVRAAIEAEAAAAAATETAAAPAAAAPAEGAKKEGK